MLGTIGDCVCPRGPCWLWVEKPVVRRLKGTRVELWQGPPSSLQKAHGKHGRGQQIASLVNRQGDRA